MIVIWFVCLAAAWASMAVMLWDVLRHGYTRRAWHIAVAQDQSANCVAGGWPDETLSARAHRGARNAEAKWRKWQLRIDWIFGAGHCEDAYDSEMARRQMPKEYRQ
jgi:hypothetical protein